MSFKPSRRLSVAGLFGAALVACAWLFAGGGAQTASAQGDACPNADVRAQQSAQHLPDCRAYEQVSPTDKNGNHAVLNAPDDEQTKAPVLYWPEIDAVTYSSLGAFADTSGGDLFNVYAATRNADGWVASGLNFPLYNDGSLGLASQFLGGFTPDLSKGLGLTGAALAPGAVAGENNIYVIDRTDGTYEFIEGYSDVYYAIDPTFVGSSPEGDRIFFSASEARGRTLQSTPPASSVADSLSLFLWEDGELKLASILPDGTAAPNTRVGGRKSNEMSLTARRAVSEDGARAYWSLKEGGAATTTGPIYLFEDGPSTLVTERETGACEPGPTPPALSNCQGNFEFATPDGSQAFLLSDDQLTADASPAGFDLYRYDADTADLVDLTPTGTSADVELVLGVSDDGSYVYFQATGDLDGGGPATAGDHNIYVWHDGAVRLVATSMAGLTDVQGTNEGVIGSWRISPNGQYLGFVIDGELTGPNSQPDPGTAQAYLYGYEGDTLVCASCPPGGSAATGPARLGLTESLSAGGFFDTQLNGYSRNVLDDGRFFFQSPDALANGDSNGKRDVYQYDDADGGVDLISSGQDAAGAVFANSSADGQHVFFATLAQLVGQDKDSLVDLYDARVNGGLASQNEEPEPECQGDECQGEQSSPPADDEPATGGQGAGNPTPPPSCEGEQGSVDRYDDRMQRLKGKKQRVKREARRSSGKKAKRLRKKAKRLRKKVRKARGKKRDAKRDLRTCREGQ